MVPQAYGDVGALGGAEFGRPAPSAVVLAYHLVADFGSYRGSRTLDLALQDSKNVWRSEAVGREADES